MVLAAHSSCQIPHAPLTSQHSVPDSMIAIFKCCNINILSESFIAKILLILRVELTAQIYVADIQWWYGLSSPGLRRKSSIQNVQDHFLIFPFSSVLSFILCESDISSCPQSIMSWSKKTLVYFLLAVHICSVSKNLFSISPSPSLQSSQVVTSFCQPWECWRLKRVEKSWLTTQEPKGNRGNC